MKKRILHCAYSGLGGHAAVLFTLLDERSREEFDHFILFFGVEDLCEDYAETCRRLKIPFAFVKKRGRVDVRGHRAVLRHIRTVRPDVVMINGSPLATPILAARALFGGRWSVVLRETQANHLKTRQEWLGSYLAARYADAVVYLTEEYRAEVEERFRRPRRRGPALVIPNGVDTSEYEAKGPSESGRVRLAMVSRLVPIKDHATLIEAVRMLVQERGHADLELHIAGDGPMLAGLRERAAAADLEGVVVFRGLLTRRGVIELLREADIYVHCTFGETMSNSILQAMAAQLPVVASDVRGVSNMIRPGEDGILVPVAEAEPLADALETLIRSPEARREMGANARRRILAELSQERMVDDYTDLMARIGGSSGTTLARRTRTANEEESHSALANR